jgi:hypothetical protein
MRASKTQHGEGKTRLYSSWRSMKQRCQNPRAHAFEEYGGRGIKVCDEWSDSFYAFKEWALSNGYHEGLSIDRIDNDKGYEPSNCRWATRSEQQRNRRNNRMVTFNNETKTMSEWAACLGIERNVLWNRLYRYGWPIERALTEPVRRIIH